MLLLIYKSCLVSDTKQYTPVMLLATTGVLTRLHHGGFFMEIRVMIDGKASRKRGYSQVSHDILEQLACRRLSGTEARLLMLLIRETYGYNNHKYKYDVEGIAGRLGASVNSVYLAISKLTSDKIVKKEGEEIGINPFFSDWTREVIGKKPEPKTTNKSTTRTTNKRGGQTHSERLKNLLDKMAREG